MTIYIFVVGAIFGSFSNAFVWRLHNRLNSTVTKNSSKKPTGVASGRSICESCGHELSSRDLIPIFSWLSLKGRCRYCKKPISIQNPLVEIAMAVVFGLSHIYWPMELDGEGQFFLVSWLIMAVLLMTMLVYDIRWLILPNVLVFPLILASIGLVLIDGLVLDGGLDAVRDAVLGLLFVGGFFYALFQISGGRWIGGGDVKLAVFMGILLGAGKGLVALYVGFFMATLVMVPLLALKKISRKQTVPFGPFLILGIFVVMIWGQDILDWYNDFIFLG